MPARCRMELRTSVDGDEDEAVDETQRMCGTMKYLPPELYIEDDDEPEAFYSYEVDVWAFGVILFEMLHAKVFFFLSCSL